MKNPCLQYKEKFLEENIYPHCENCSRTDKGFEVHHIYYRSAYPKHEELNNFRNLILVCLDCHAGFHQGILKDELEKLIEERGLKDLFTNDKK